MKYYDHLYVQMLSLPMIELYLAPSVADTDLYDKTLLKTPEGSMHSLITLIPTSLTPHRPSLVVDACRQVVSARLLYLKRRVELV